MLSANEIVSRHPKKVSRLWFFSYHKFEDNFNTQDSYQQKFVLNEFLAKAISCIFEILRTQNQL
jgi:hypothetical protein